VEPIYAKSFVTKGHATVVSKLCLRRLAVLVAERFSSLPSLVELDHRHATLTVLVVEPVAILKSSTSATKTPSLVPNVHFWWRNPAYVGRRL
jgi:hypothetical protein